MRFNFKIGPVVFRHTKEKLAPSFEAMLFNRSMVEDNPKTISTNYFQTGLVVCDKEIVKKDNQTL